MQIVVWGVFRSGEAQGIEEGEDAVYLPDALAVCLNEKCGGEFQWRQFVKTEIDAELKD